MKRYPFSAFPNGWFAVAASDQVASKGVLPLHCLGHDWVLFRAESGAVHMLDAFCPHLGAHLGHGGRVEGECVRCPFHAWKFDGSGACVEIPYARKIPPRALLRRWPVREVNGLIMVYHDAQGAAPPFEFPQIAEHGAAEWTPFHEQRWRVRMHCQEVGENAADAAHQRFLHQTGLVPQVLELQDQGPVFELRTRLPGMRTHVTMYGLGAEVFRARLHLSCGPVECLDAIFTTPIDGEYVEHRHFLSVRRKDTEAETEVAAQTWIKTATGGVDDDVLIWERKAYRQPPNLCDGDGPIGQFRRWARQFYPETSAQSAPGEEQAA